MKGAISLGMAPFLFLGGLFLCHLFVADLCPAFVGELVVIAQGCLDFVERFALRDHLFYLRASCLGIGDSLLDVSLGLDVAVSGDEDVGVKRDDAFRGRDPALG